MDNCPAKQAPCSWYYQKKCLNPKGLSNCPGMRRKGKAQ
jgi:hypothetical protein